MMGKRARVQPYQTTPNEAFGYAVGKFRSLAKGPFPALGGKCQDIDHSAGRQGRTSSSSASFTISGFPRAASSSIIFS